MPNWCMNKLDVYGSKEEFDKFLELVKIPSANVKENQYGEDDVINLSLSSIVPPEDTEIETLKRLWSVDRDLFDVDVERPTDEHAEFRFNSAWEPPCNWLMATACKFPELEFEGIYAEPGGVFCGFLSAKGEEFSDDFHDGELLTEIMADLGCEEFLEDEENDECEDWTENDEKE